jgi:hypothetical protein
MSTDLDKLKGMINEEKKNDEERKKRQERGDIGFYRPEVGKNCLYLCPAHENMDGIPYVKRGKHRNCGPEGKTDFMCRRSTGKEPINDCPQCVEIKELYGTGKERDKKKASRMRRSQRFYWNVINMRPLLELGDDEKVTIPDCFLDYPDEEDKKTRKARGCKRCDYIDACEEGVIVFSFGPKIKEQLFDELEPFLKKGIDVTNPKGFYPLQFKRKGEEVLNTDYTGVKFGDKVKFPDEVVARINEGLIDLSELSIPKGVDEVKKLMSGVPTEDADDENGEEDKPKCFGKYDDDEEKCLKCDYSDPCEVETEGSGPSDNDDEEEKKKPPKRSAAKDVDDDEEEEEEKKSPKRSAVKEEEEEEEEEKEKKPPKRSAVKEEEDDDDPPPKKSAAKDNDDLEATLRRMAKKDEPKEEDEDEDE